MTAEFSKEYRVGKNRRVVFSCPDPTAGGIIAGTACWWPSLPSASDLNETDWRDFTTARADFHRRVEDKFGVIVEPNESIQ